VAESLQTNPTTKNTDFHTTVLNNLHHREPQNWQPLHHNTFGFIDAHHREESRDRAAAIADTTLNPLPLYSRGIGILDSDWWTQCYWAIGSPKSSLPHDLLWNEVGEHKDFGPGDQHNPTEIGRGCSYELVEAGWFGSMEMENMGERITHLWQIGKNIILQQGQHRWYAWHGCRVVYCDVVTNCDMMDPPIMSQ
jgi:hypothetical protein